MSHQTAAQKILPLLSKSSSQTEQTCQWKGLSLCHILELRGRKNSVQCFSVVLQMFSISFLPCSYSFPNGNPLQYSCLGNPMDKAAWWATVHGVSRVQHDLAAKPPLPPILSHSKSKQQWNYFKIFFYNIILQIYDFFNFKYKNLIIYSKMTC